MGYIVLLVNLGVQPVRCTACMHALRQGYNKCLVDVFRSLNQKAIYFTKVLSSTQHFATIGGDTRRTAAVQGLPLAVPVVS
jgi:hypothetical protein